MSFGSKFEKKNQKKSDLEICEIKIRSLEYKVCGISKSHYLKMKTCIREKRSLKLQNKRLNEETLLYKKELDNIKLRLKDREFSKIEQKIKQLKSKLKKESEENKKNRDRIKSYEEEVSILSDALSEQYGSGDVSKILYKLSKYKSQYHDLLKEFEKKNSKINNIEREKEKNKENIESLLNDYKNVCDEKEVISEINEQLSEEISVMGEEVKCLIDKIEEKDRDNLNYKGIQEKIVKNKEMKKNYEDLMKNYNNLEGKYKEICVMFEKNEEKMKKSLPQINVLKAKLKRFELEKENLKEQLRGKSYQLDQFARINNELRLYSEKAKKDLIIIFKKMKNVKRRNSQLVEIINASKKSELFERNRIQEEKSRGRNNINNLKKEKYDIIEKKMFLEKENRDLKLKIKELEEIIKEQKERLKNLCKTKNLLEKSLTSHLNEKRKTFQRIKSRNESLENEKDTIVDQYKKLKILYDVNNSVVDSSMGNFKSNSDNNFSIDIGIKKEEDFEDKTDFIIRKTSKFLQKTRGKNFLLE